MRLAFILWLCALLCGGAYASQPKYGPNAVPLSRRSNLEYFQKNPAPDYWALSPYYLGQNLGQQCSAAVLSMVLNAARSPLPLTADEPLVTLSSLLEKYTDADYRLEMSAPLERLKSGDFHFKRITNQRIVELLQQAATKLAIATPATRIENGRVDLKHPETSRAAFHEALIANEKSSDDFLIISFIQGDLTGDPEGGSHVAAIGAYDSVRKLVLIMDPDREWYEPYWSPEDKVFDSIANPKSDGENPGWVHFKVR